MASDTTLRPLKIAILAMGGEGGGVLADWIVGAAENEGFFAQSTSVPGVAQRTGATIYYVEVLPVPRQQGRQPVFGLMPTPGDVDVVIASELMESARAVERGLVTVERTVLITSCSRTYSLAEKAGMGDGRVDSEALREAGEQSARQYVARDFARIARDNASVISAALFGALAASGTMPWPRRAFEAAIERGGVGVANSLKAFAAGHEAWAQAEPPAASPSAPALDQRLARLAERVERELPAAARVNTLHGLARTADYQGEAYAQEYLDHLCRAARWPAIAGGDGLLLGELARHLALWMSYEDPARVAELKLRRTRVERVHREVRAKPQQLVHIHEFFHPRFEEVIDSLPVGLGRWVAGSALPRRLLQRGTGKGRIIRSTSLPGFALLYLVAQARRWRPASLRHQREQAHIHRWLEAIEQACAHDPALAAELVACQRLVKGYGDTHARGMRSYASILAALPQLPPAQAAEWVRRLREAALADDSGKPLRELLASLEAAQAPIATEKVST